MIIVRQLLAGFNFSVRDEVNLVLSVDGFQVDVDVRFARVRQAPGVVVLVHGVAKEHRVALGVASGTFDLHVVKLGWPLVVQPSRLLHGANRVLFLRPRPRRINLSEEIDEELTLLDGFVAHDAETFTVN